MLDCAAAEGEDQRVGGGEAGDGLMLADAEGGLAVAGEELGDGCAGFGLNHVVDIDECQPRRWASSGPTVLLPEPMKPVRTMRRGGVG
jgi:hypothetical protein